MSVMPARPTGHIKISRKAFRDDPWWNEARTFSRWEAWEDCIQMASWRDATRTSKAGDAVFLKRGEFVASLRFLAQRWGWTVKQVRGFVTIARRMGRFRAQRETPIGTVYLIVNYDRYQTGAEAEGTAEGTARAQEGHSKGTKKKQLSSTLHTADGGGEDDDVGEDPRAEQLEASPTRQALAARFASDAERADVTRFLDWLPAEVSREGWALTIAGFFDGCLLAGLKPATPAAVASALRQFPAQREYALTPRNVARFVDREMRQARDDAPAALPARSGATHAPAPVGLCGATLRPVIERAGLASFVSSADYWRKVAAACPAGVDPAAFRRALEACRPWDGWGGLTFPPRIEQEIDTRLAAAGLGAEVAA